MTFWWLSFADPAKPVGEQFLGAAIVEGEDIKDAVAAAWLNACNPGGEIEWREFPSDIWPPPKFRNQLLSRADIDALDLVLAVMH